MSQRELRDFNISVGFESASENQTPPAAKLYAFDASGQPLASAPIQKGEVKLRLDAMTASKSVRLIVGPDLGEKQTPSIADLRRLGAYERRVRLAPDTRLTLNILNSTWLKWLTCACTVRWRVFKRVPMPDGTARELPITNARVTICEVDRLPLIISRIPDDTLVQIRDDILDLIRRPIPIPEPDPGPIRFPIPLPDPVPFINPLPQPAPVPLRLAENISNVSRLVQPISRSQPTRLELLSSEAQARVLNLSALSSTSLRQSLIDISDLIYPWLCYLSIFDYFFHYHLDCSHSVMVDENGEFQTTIYYPCFGDKPDLYFKVQQLQNGVWKTVYAPSVRCHTYWNYQCGTEVNIHVTDPSAIPTFPDDPVTPPTGVTTWIMPLSVGYTYIWGNPGTPDPAPSGWVKPNGLTDYSGYNNAPFGGFLSFRLAHANSIPNGIRYYRWGYRKGTSGDWTYMRVPVSRYYVKESPGMLPTFPSYQLGPNTVAGRENMFEFKPVAPPAPEPSDPPGTVTYWPTDDSLSSIFHGHLNTTELAEDGIPAADDYQIKLEVFDGAGNPVAPGAAFSFIVPESVNPTAGIEARLATAGEITTSEPIQGFVFTLHVDNNTCDAVIHKPNIGGSTAADECGFLPYDPGDLVTVAFEASHPNNFAEFSFGIVRGSHGVPGAGVSGAEVSALAAGVYSGDGSGNFTHNFALPALLNDPALGIACQNAAFAESLYVYAKATNGVSRQHQYDASDLEAFALSKN